jgi:hypothetical protein
MAALMSKLPAAASATSWSSSGSWKSFYHSLVSTGVGAGVVTAAAVVGAAVDLNAVGTSTSGRW